MKKTSPRLDQRLVELGLAESRAKAQALIMAGQVEVNGARADKPGTRVDPEAEISIKEGLPYASRGGKKLEAALDFFRLDPGGKICMDVGSSTGGFADCLLQRGAAKVYAVDVGKGILDWKLRNDPRLQVMEGQNARFLARPMIEDDIEFMTMDLSFISLTLVLPAVRTLLSRDARVVALVKPQFEAGRGKVGKGGVVRDEEVIKECVDRVSEKARELGLVEQGRLPSPIKGPKGNQEVLLYLSLLQKDKN